MKKGLSLIVAADEKDTIGRDGGLPWHLSEDLKRFKRLTVGHVVIAGRLTQDSIVARLGTPLPDRTTIVVSRTPGPDRVSSFAEALRRAEELAGDDEVFVIGGAQIYAAALPHVETVHLTRVHRTVDGDVRMPDGWLGLFKETDREEHGEFTWLTYRRRLYYPPFARSEDQRAEMDRLEKEDECVFCPGHSGQTVLFRGTQWTVQRNRYPYQGTKEHLLLVPDAHVTDLADLSPEAQAGFWDALRWARDHCGLQYYGLAARNGDVRYTGSTIRHLHVHVLVGDPDQDPVRVKLSSRPEGSERG